MHPGGLRRPPRGSDRPPRGPQDAPRGPKTSPKQASKSGRATRRAARPINGDGNEDCETTKTTTCAKYERHPPQTEGRRGKRFFIICFADRRGPPPPPSPPLWSRFWLFGGPVSSRWCKHGGPASPPPWWMRESLFRATVHCVFGALLGKIRQGLQGAGCAEEKHTSAGSQL